MGGRVGREWEQRGISERRSCLSLRTYKGHKAHIRHRRFRVRRMLQIAVLAEIASSASLLATISFTVDVGTSYSTGGIPLPVANLWHVLSVGVDVVLVFNKFISHVLLKVSSFGT